MSELADKPIVITPEVIWATNQSHLRIYYALLGYLAWYRPNALTLEQLVEHARWYYYMCAQRTPGPVYS